MKNIINILKNTYTSDMNMMHEVVKMHQRSNTNTYDLSSVMHYDVCI